MRMIRISAVDEDDPHLRFLLAPNTPPRRHALRPTRTPTSPKPYLGKPTSFRPIHALLQPTRTPRQP